MLLMIDNYDSFTYNLVHYFGELGADVQVYRNDALSLETVARLNPEKIVISPGPCTPEEAGICIPLIKAFAGKIPILGVCLGHQALAAAFGGRIVRCQSVQHGKTATIHHYQRGLFTDIPSIFSATLYNSLVIKLDSLPDCFTIQAWTQDSKGAIHEIMAIQHRNAALFGVQFHPESILTEHGHQLLQNFLTY